MLKYHRHWLSSRMIANNSVVVEFPSKGNVHLTSLYLDYVPFVAHYLMINTVDEIVSDSVVELEGVYINIWISAN